MLLPQVRLLLRKIVMVSGFFIAGTKDWEKIFFFLVKGVEDISEPQIFTASYVAGENSRQFNIGLNLNNNPLNSLGLGFRIIL